MPAEQPAASPSDAKENSKHSAENEQLDGDKESGSPLKEAEGDSATQASATEATSDKNEDDAASRARQRQERFKALKARAVSAL